MAKRWIFLEDRTQYPTRWSWRQLGADGRIERQSEDFDGYGMAVRNAISHGFHPKIDHWIIESGHSLVHCQDGKDAVLIPKKDFPPRKAGPLKRVSRSDAAAPKARNHSKMQEEK